MADDRHVREPQVNGANSTEKDQNGVHNGNDASQDVVESTGLVQFVMQEVQRQKMKVVDLEEEEEQQQIEEPELDQRRERNFVTSALSAIQKMNAEVDKSTRKRNSLHEQFGAQRFHDWQEEHSRQVLTPHQADLVSSSNRII